jgi:diphthamide biosynthesis enzyme Dph1/Dph2-like protein
MVKLLYIDSRLKGQSSKLDKEELKKLPKEIFLAYSLQYKEVAESIKEQLDVSNINVTGFQQVLGCSKVSTKSPILLIGSGRFHAKNLYLQAPSVYLMTENKIEKIPQEEVDRLHAKRKTAMIKFLGAQNIGILVSTKPGQENLGAALKLKEKLTNEGKKANIFVSDLIDIGQFENFHIDSWVNTSCPGLSYDSPMIINLNEL